MPWVSLSLLGSESPFSAAFSNDKPAKSWTSYVIIRMRGRRSIASWSSPSVKRRNTTHCKSWRKRSKHDGKLYPRNSVKVGVRQTSPSFVDLRVLAIKQYIVSLVISHSQNPELMEREKVYLNKLDVILVQVRRRRARSSLILPVHLDLETRMAKEMAEFHQWYCRGQ